jgi:thiol-disulfide isomerase/thioredoxin
MPGRAGWLNPGMSQGAWVLIVALGVATVFGSLRAARDGRFRGTHQVKGAPATDAHEGSVLHDSDIAHELGERATLLQFSSAFCAPCRVTRRTLADVARAVPGVVHVEVDAEHHLELVRRLGILRTPTTLVLDARGQEVTRASGAPKRDEVMATLGRVIAP